MTTGEFDRGSTRIFSVIFQRYGRSRPDRVAVTPAEDVRKVGASR
jgi:hypothetical protein